MRAFYFQLYILSKKREKKGKKKKTCDVTSALLPPNEGAPAQGSTRIQKHMLIRRYRYDCKL